MKHYPFARLYLGLLMIMAGVALLSGIGLIIFSISRASKATNTLNAEKETPVIIDTAALVTQMQGSLSTVQSISPSFSYNLPTPGDLPISQYAFIKGDQIYQLETLVEQYGNAIPTMKTAFLSQFNENIDKLISAARTKLSQIAPETKPLYATKSRGRLYSDSIATERNAANELRNASYFLLNRVQYYSPSEAAHNAALLANTNITAALGIYQSDLKTFELVQESSQLESTAPISAQQRPQAEILGEFIDNLWDIRFNANRYLLDEWAVEQTLSSAAIKLKNKISAISELEGIRVDIWTTAAKSFLYCLGLAVLFLVIRDFLSAAIDTAQNTSVMKDSLHGIVTFSPDNSSSSKVAAPSICPGPLPVADPGPQHCDCPECGKTMPISQLSIADNGITKCPYCNAYFKIEKD